MATVEFSFGPWAWKGKQFENVTASDLDIPLSVISMANVLTIFSDEKGLRFIKSRDGSDSRGDVLLEFSVRPEASQLALLRASLDGTGEPLLPDEDSGGLC